MKINNKRGLFVLLIALLCFLVACGQSPSDKKATKNTKEAPENTYIKIKTTEGEITVPKNPKKVIVFDMGSLDTIEALGMQERVVGVPTENLPKYLAAFKDVPSVGGIKEPDLEKINQLQPDLIIISGRQADFKKELSKIAPTLYLEVDEANIWHSTKQNITSLGKIFARESQAKKSLAKLDQVISDLATSAKAANLPTTVTLVNEGELSVYGAKSRFGIVFDTFGFPAADKHIQPSIHGQAASYEYLLETNPAIIFVIDRSKAIGGDTSKNEVAANPLVKKTQAGKTNKVISLTPDVWYLSGGGLTCTELMIADVEKALK